MTREKPLMPSIALLDAWATVADVLTFYQERIANEGYLRTPPNGAPFWSWRDWWATSSGPAWRRVSIWPTRSMTSSKMKSPFRPEAGPRAFRAGELPQSFETSEDLKARAKWNNLKPRMTQPQTLESILSHPNGARIYLKGVNTGLTSNDPLIIVEGDRRPQFLRVKEVKPDAEADHSVVTLLLPLGDGAEPEPLANPVELIKELTLRPSLQPRNTLRLRRKLADQFSEKAGAGYRAVGGFTPQLRETLPLAAANARVTPESELKVYALRVEASLFGHNAPREPQYFPKGDDQGRAGTLKPQPWDEWRPDGEDPQCAASGQRLRSNSSRHLCCGQQTG